MRFAAEGKGDGPLDCPERLSGAAAVVREGRELWVFAGHLGPASSAALHKLCLVSLRWQHVRPATTSGPAPRNKLSAWIHKDKLERRWGVPR